MWVYALAIVILVSFFGGIIQDAFAQAHVADAGPDQTVTSGDTVTLDASDSMATGTTILTWTQKTGPPIILSDASVVQPTFTAPTGPATLTIELAVLDGNTLQTLADIVTITVIPPLPPIANAGSDKTGYINDTITLDGTASTDPNGDALTYSWSPNSETPTITIDDHTSARTTFTAPSEPITLEFTLTVQDATHTATDSITITIKERPAQPRNIKEMKDTLISAQITGPNQITMAYNEELSTFINSYLNFTISGEDTARNITGIDGAPSKNGTITIDGESVDAYITILTFDGEPAPAGATGSMYMQHADHYLAFLQVSNGQS